MEVCVKFEISDLLCMALLTTCVEGGSSYWLACERVVRDADLNVKMIVGPCDREDEETVWSDVDIDTIRLGIQRMVEDPKLNVAKRIRTALIPSLWDPDECYWDAEVADVCLQVGMFGEIVYG